MLLKDFQEHPKDEATFNTKCTEIVSTLLPDLREEYTETQLPTVLRDSCEVMRHKEDFRKDEDGTKVTEPVLNRAQVQCKYFATELTKEYEGEKKYDGWCKRVFKYLTDVSIPRKEVARRIKERNIARANLQKVKEEWDAFRDLKGKAWMRRNKFKRELSDWKKDGAFGVGVAPKSTAKADEAKDEDEEEDDDKDSKDGDPDGVDGEDDDDANATMVDDNEWRKCCPKGCKVCSGFNLQNGVVRAVSFHGAASAVKMEDNEEAEDNEAETDKDSDSDDEDDEDDDDDDNEEAEEESEDDEDDVEEADEEDDDDDNDDVFEAIAKTSLLQRNHSPKKKAKANAKASKKKALPAKRNKTDATVPAHLTGGFFYLLTKEFSRLPKTEEFLGRCSKVVSKLMPDLHEEYTWKQVPFVLKHDCEVYATKTDFKTSRMQLNHAEKSCKFFSKRLWMRYKTDKDYKEWCSNVYAHLLRESDGKDLTDKQKKLLKTHKNFGKEIYELDDKCCPANCRMC